MPELLIELFSEEIPARMQSQAASNLQRLMTEALAEAGVSYGNAHAFSTPRRLCLVIEDISAQSLPRQTERKGPRVDAPEKAIEGFLRATGLARDALARRDTPKGEVYFATLKSPARKTEDVVAEALPKIIQNFPWPKSMRWGSGDLRWVRPLHRILCILSDKTNSHVVPFSIENLSSTAQTEGHRVHAKEAFEVKNFEDYQSKLAKAYVMLDPAQRIAEIRANAETLAFASGLEIVPDEALIAEIAGLVEWPVTLMGKIDPEFINLPAKVLQTSMREHQKFLSLSNPKSGRIEGFITVANIQSPDKGAAILAGNLRVLRARLADAQFFWENDLKIAHQGMALWQKKLHSVTFQNQLGSQGARVARIAQRAKELAPNLKANPQQAFDCAQIIKADLCSEMVYEFPELQGTMGQLYAEKAGMAPEISSAIKDHYAPLGPADPIPTAPLSITLALADKLDLLTGFWLIDEKPTSSKDPFALRRAALGIIRIILENNLTLDLKNEITKSLNIYEKDTEKTQSLSSNLMVFFHDRLAILLRDQGRPHDVIAATMAVEKNDLALIAARAHAIDKLLKTPTGEDLLQAYKRAINILTQAEENDGVSYSYGTDKKFIKTPEEKALFAALEQIEAEITPALACQDFDTAIQKIASLRNPLDTFFKAVHINSENPMVRRNRLNLLHRIRVLMDKIADFSLVEAKKHG